MEENVVAQFKDMNPPEDETLPLFLHLLKREIKGLILQITKDITEDDPRQAKAQKMAWLAAKAPRWVAMLNLSLSEFRITIKCKLGKLTSMELQMKPPEKQASELKEKLLREKIKKMRTSSGSNSTTRNS